MHWPGSVRRTHSLTLVTLSERVSLARTHARGPGARRDPERRGKVCSSPDSRLIAVGSALAPRPRQTLGIPSSRLRTLGTQAASASATVGNNSGGRPQAGAPSRCQQGSWTPSRPPSPGRKGSVLPACKASAEERLRRCPRWGPS